MKILQPATAEEVCEEKGDKLDEQIPKFCSLPLAGCW